MSNFTALNVVYEDESEEEIDDSKELQIEEALKLYQNALKLHSQGPDFYDLAETAYKELLASEVFSYAESLSEARWLEQYGDELLDYGDDEDLTTELPTGVATGGEGAPSTLPQVLYLAYKNYGLFRLDQLREQLLQIEHVLLDEKTQTKHLSEAATTGLQNLAEALDRDESDLELWRKVARISQYLGSHRIARFCLEAVLSDGLDSSDEPLSLEQAFANEQLQPLLATIGDMISKRKIETASSNQKSQRMVKALRKYIDPYPYLPTATPRTLADQMPPKAAEQEIKVPSKTWASCGAAILSRINAEQLYSGDGAINSNAGASFFLTFPATGSTTGKVSSPESLALKGNLNLETKATSIARRPSDQEDPSAAAATAAVGEAAEVIESPTKIDDENPEQAVLSSKSVTPTSGGQNEEPTLPDDAENVENVAPVSEPSGRKRSSATADLAEGVDGGRARSKRIKTRGSITDPTALDTTAEDWTKWYKQQLEVYVIADEAAFSVAGQILAQLGCGSTPDTQEAKDIDAEGLKSDRPPEGAALDLKQLLGEWDIAKSKLLLNGHSPSVGVGLEGASNDGFSTFMTQATVDNSTSRTDLPILPEDGLEDFANDIHGQPWTNLSGLAFRWITRLLEQRQTSSSPTKSSAYETFLWPDDVKEIMVQLLVNQDEYIYNEIQQGVEQQISVGPAVAASTADHPAKSEDEHEKLIALVQTISEMHLDIYSQITNPNSEVDHATRAAQRDRLSRWAALASRAMNETSWSFAEEDDEKPHKSWQLMYRFLWASVVCNSLQDPNASSEATVAYFQHLIMQYKADSDHSNRLPTMISLPNNAIMPEVSVRAAEREVSRLTTLEYFTSIFSSTTDKDPISVIEKLEPLLLLSVNNEGLKSGGSSPVTDAEAGAEHNANGEDLDADRDLDNVQAQLSQDPRLLKSLHFLRRASLSMRLVLWQRLQDAYSIINYPPQILTCNLWSLIIIVQHLVSPSYLETAKKSKAGRQENLLKWLHKLDELMTQVLALASTDSSSFECVDQDQLVSSLESVASLQRIVQVFACWEDEIRVGQTQPTPQTSAASKAQLKAAEKFREMIVKTWTLQYVLIKEAVAQKVGSVQPSSQELFAYLKAAHNALGLRTYCGLVNRMFLKLAKTELGQMKEVEGWDTEMPQVMFDLYGLKISSAPADTQDHGCEPMELDRATALEVLDLLLLHVGYLSMKDLLKNDIRFAVDKMQSVIKVPKASHGSARNFNKRLIAAYLKSPINPLALYRSIKGIGELCSMPVQTEGHEVAAKGWYFLLGHIALTKFRSQKRITAGSVEDLDNAKLFFKQDLEFDTSRWETWYRLAQTYDTQIDEYTTWTAEKLENEEEMLVDLQRTAILCYIMAVAAAERCETAWGEHASTLAGLYTDFGIRLYASTREPFNARVFNMTDFKRKFNGAARGMYEDIPFMPVPVYSVWKFASVLLRKAAQQKPRDWYIQYMLGKILWKMHNSDSVRPPIHSQLAIDAIIQSIRCLPERRDSRHPDKDPILEPHYKLLSIVYKLVRSKRPESTIVIEQACHILKATPYARKVPDVQETEDWEQYILAVLKAMRSADKSNWHHRMVVRAAHIIYDENPNDMLAVLGAKHELSQQIFTKTMTIQVWKPDNERAGRHFVYTGRYMSFFADLLVKTNDRDNMDMLARRIRRKAGDFVNHTRIWQEYSMKYLKLLRKTIPVPEEHEEYIFSKISPEEFAQGASRLETWVLAPGNECQHIDVLREAMEFKKLNNNLMDRTVIENLIADVYAWIYNRYVDELRAKETAEENRVRMSVDTILTTPIPNRFIPMYGPPESSAAAGGVGGEPHGKGVRRQFSVTRRMIIAKAEGLIVKPPPIPTPRAIPRALAPAPLPGQSAAIAVVIPQEGNAVGEAISVPGSVHDSADDESELSDVEDLVEDPSTTQALKKSTSKPIFPNLLGIKADDEDAGSTVGGDEEEEEEEPKDDTKDDDATITDPEGPQDVSKDDDATMSDPEGPMGVGKDDDATMSDPEGPMGVAKDDDATISDAEGAKDVTKDDNATISDAATISEAEKPIEQDNVDA